MEPSFVYEGTEVKKTGRIAERGGTVGRSGRETKKFILVEIAPIDDPDSWKKWVDPDQLYIVAS